MTCYVIVEDEGMLPQLWNLRTWVILSNFWTRIRSHLRSLFKCINKFGIDQLKEDLIEHQCAPESDNWRVTTIFSFSGS